MRPRLAAFVAAAAALALAAHALGGIVLINGVPDWQQPYDTYVPPGPDPNPGLLTDPYDNYCVPTAAANAFGWWEDVQGFTGVADQQVAPASPGYAGNLAAPTWQQGLWHDGVVELGWFLDTNDVNPVPADAHIGTKLVDISPGMMGYGMGAWVDATTPIAKTGYTTTAWPMTAATLPGGTTPWDDYIADIDAGRPALVSFDYWNPVGGFSTNTYPEVDWFYDWGPHPGTSLGHTVTGMGYVDFDGNNATDADKYWIVHDTWSSTQATIGIPYFWLNQSAYQWIQNDHLFLSAAGVPEPGTAVLLLLGWVLLRRRMR